MANRCYINDVGTLITLETGANLTTLAPTVKIIKVKKPNGDLRDWVATVANTTQLTYTLIAGDVDQAGTYQLQSYAEAPTGTWRGNTTSLEVLDVFAS
jgi:hypothetical protein